ncbi:hypothetical protein SAPIO_CDS5585 [Scedosporium apiospermum]|uniref:Uncharacterized protein n=1 Tax=Pseudallescheria apiosperma TaxID=563466 RepID=A0A084G4Z0_PSEDA|nr:uncharacterized protein SAPIO_CDS5585 [Scedosporium apiospermum]KEZ42402.1 hypothetical protein SAPIO_CDS5585 [Scedosporium apiospermum]
MTLKRKRSISELSSSPVRPSSSCFTSPASSINFSFNSFAGPSSPTPMARNPAHLNSRTLKRFRDSRPSEEEVHPQRQQQRSAHPFVTTSTSSFLEVTVGSNLSCVNSLGGHGSGGFDDV